MDVLSLILSQEVALRSCCNCPGVVLYWNPGRLYSTRPRWAASAGGSLMIDPLCTKAPQWKHQQHLSLPVAMRWVHEQKGVTHPRRHFVHGVALPVPLGVSDGIEASQVPLLSLWQHDQPNPSPTPNTPGRTFPYHIISEPASSLPPCLPASSSSCAKILCVHCVASPSSSSYYHILHIRDCAFICMEVVFKN